MEKVGVEMGLYIVKEGGVQKMGRMREKRDIEEERGENWMDGMEKTKKQ